MLSVTCLVLYYCFFLVLAINTLIGLEILQELMTHISLYSAKHVCAEIHIVVSVFVTPISSVISVPVVLAAMERKNNSSRVIVIMLV